MDAKETDFYIVPALSQGFTYFLFRDGVEIKFTCFNGKITIVSKGYLRPEEEEFIKNTYL